MATVNKLLLETASLEADLRAKIAGDETAVQAVRAGFAVAQIAATHCILELLIKGVIPEGKGGRIMDEVREAVEASRERVTG